MLKVGQRSKQAAPYETMADLPLVQAVIREDRGAWEALVHRYGHHIYALCTLFFDAEELEASCLTMFTMLREDHFAVLRVFDGHATLATYLTLVLGNRLAGEILALFHRDIDRAWRAFERFFQKDMRRIVAQSFPPGRDASTEGSTPDDRYQEICLQLLAHEGLRIKAYNGQGAFVGYIHRVVRHLCVDLVRKEAGRRRLPERIKQLSALEQEVFKYLYWEGHEEDAGRRLLLAQGSSSAQAEQALAQMRATVEGGRQQPTRWLRAAFPTAEHDGVARQPEFPDATLTPEQTLIEVETQAAQAAMLTVLQEAIAQLPDDEQRFIRLRYLTVPQPPPRDIAPLMERSVEEVYKLGRRAVAHLQTYLQARGVQSVV
jgi:RNA polymerase sigma factor (sigma-70 family)